MQPRKYFPGYQKVMGSCFLIIKILDTEKEKENIFE
jgi:hypothetical protein